MSGTGAVAGADSSCSAAADSVNSNPACAPFAVTAVRPVIIPANGVVTLSGVNFRSDLQVTANGSTGAAGVYAAVSVQSGTSAQVSFPLGVPSRSVDLYLTQDGFGTVVSLLGPPAKTDYPTSTANPALICAGSKFYDASGNLLSGIRDCNTPASSCTQDGATACLATAAYPAAALSAAIPANILAGVTLAGVPGTATVAAGVACSADGQTGCLAVSDFPAVNRSVLTPSSIVAGITFGGVAGTHVLPPSCTSDGQQGCLATGNFAAANTAAITSWDLRYGVTRAGVTGTLKTACRNGINSAVFNTDSPDDNANTSGTSLDPWDTIDDISGTATQLVAGWTTANLCGAEGWTDATTANGGVSSSSCAAAPASCQYKDQISNLTLSGEIGTAVTWSAAVNGCYYSTYGGFAVGTWRLPTAKEMLSFSEHGVLTLASANFISAAAMATTFWTSTTYASSSGSAEIGSLAVGIGPAGAGNTAKNSTEGYLCVRGGD